MTFGSKLKYYRHKCNITQLQLSELSGISLVSIKRYENDKMTPTQPQFEKLAEALGIGVSALAETSDFAEFRDIQTYGDLMRLLIVLRKNRLILIDGKRSSAGKLEKSSVAFKANPLVGAIFKLNDSGEPLSSLSFSLANDKFLERFLDWESAYAKFEKLSEQYHDSGSAAVQQKLKENGEILAKVELELQYESILLERVDGHITVKVTPELGNEDILSELREKAIAEELKKQSKNKK